MKITECCGRCNSKSKKATITITPEDRNKFLAFTQEAQKVFANDPRGRHLFIPPSKYPKHPIVIPSPGENPCSHCKIGLETVGPSGCGRGATCLAYIYFSFNVLKNKTEIPLNIAVRDMSP